MNQTTRAKAFAELHQGPDILVLPNAWDAASAALMADAGARAVATSSAAVAWAYGYPDGDALPVDKLIETVAAIVRVVDAPVTCDFEGGYTDDLDALKANIAKVIGAGAVGINLEDGTRDPDLHARKVAAAREAAEAQGVDLFINARTDVFLKGLAEGEAAVAESIRRVTLYADAGASGAFVPFVREEAHIRAVADAIALPLNVILMPGLAPVADLQSWGVRRLSSGTAPFRSAYGTLAKAAAAYLANGDVAAFAEGADGLPNLNKRFSAG